LRVVEGEVRRMEASLRTFLDFARPPKPERRPFELGEVLRAVAGLVRGRAERQGVEVRVDAPPTPVTADREQLRQVFVNLALNAVDAMPTGGRLSITSRSGSPGVTVEVADTGTGIAPELAGKLFQPFVSTKETGLGLGLVISKRIIEEHHGTLTAANRADGGAVLTVHLPAAVN
jgi:signal transduction histidine kinase